MKPCPYCGSVSPPMAFLVEYEIPPCRGINVIEVIAHDEASLMASIADKFPKWKVLKLTTTETKIL